MSSGYRLEERYRKFIEEAEQRKYVNEAMAKIANRLRNWDAIAVPHTFEVTFILTPTKRDLMRHKLAKLYREVRN